MEREVDQHIKCQGLVRKALNLHHYSSSSRDPAGLIQTIYTQLEERSGLSSAETFNREKHVSYLSGHLLFFGGAQLRLSGIPLIIFKLHNVQLSFQS